jgi:hypothetical protein
VQSYVNVKVFPFWCTSLNSSIHDLSVIIPILGLKQIKDLNFCLTTAHASNGNGRIAYLDKEYPKIDDDIDLQLNWLGVVGLSPVPPLATSCVHPHPKAFKRCQRGANIESKPETQCKFNLSSKQEEVKAEADERFERKISRKKNSN